MVLGNALNRNIESNSCSRDDRNLGSPKIIKQTLIHSPIFTNIFPNFNVNIHKPFKGFPNRSIDESDQYLVPKSNSQLDDFSDEDEDVLILEQAMSRTKSPSLNSPIGNESCDQELVSIKVIVKITSIIVDGIEYGLMAPIRSSCIIPGVTKSDKNEQSEDHLLISLKSGFLMLIKIFLVPRDGSDPNCLQPKNDIIQEERKKIFKPFIVQWWDTTEDSTFSSMMSSGHSVYCHSSGKSAVSTSGSHKFRIYNSEITSDGSFMLGPHTNVPLDGIILKACFAEPLVNCIVDSHIMFMTLVFTNSRRLEINLYEWNFDECVTGKLSKNTLPLNNNFPIPIHVVPLKGNAGFVFISPNDITMITIHQILSGEYDFKNISLDISFPSSVYCPVTKCRKLNEQENEILISSDTGSIYSLIIPMEGSFSIKQIARVSDPISVFVLEKLPQGNFYLFFGSDNGSNRELIISDLFADDVSAKMYSKTKILSDYKNWSPLLDVIAIDSYKQNNINNHTDQELWTLVGSGKRTKLLQLRTGVIANRLTKSYSELRKALKIQFIAVREKSYFILMFINYTKVFEYIENLEEEENENEFLKESEDIGMNIHSYTILLTQMDSICIQVTESSIWITNFIDKPIIAEFSDKRILIARSLQNYLLLITEDDNHEVNLELLKLDMNILSFNENICISDFAEVVFQSSMNFEISMADLILKDDEIIIILGTYKGEIKILSEIKNSCNTENILLSKLNTYSNEKSESCNLIIPHSALFISETQKFFIGTKDGYLIEFNVNEHFTLNCEKFLSLSDTSITFQTLPSEQNLFLVISRNLWLVDQSRSKFPTKVFFSENFDKATFAVVPLPDTKFNKCLAFLREDGMSIGNILTDSTTSVKSVHLKEPAFKMLYIPHLSVFMIMTKSKQPRSRLKFIDRKTLKAINHLENSKSKWLPNDASIMKENEIPLCASIWSITRQNNQVSKKVLVGFSNGVKGSFKIIDVSILDNGSGDKEIGVKELNSFDWIEPISCVTQIGSTIIFSSNGSINATSYNVLERRLNKVKNLASLPSAVLSLKVVHDTELLITTKSDSIYKFSHMHNDLTDEDALTLIARDPSPKSLVNEAQLGNNVIISDKLHSTVLVLQHRGEVLREVMSIKLSGISRVLPSRFKSIWVPQDKMANVVICAAVNGEIVLLKALDADENPATEERLKTPFSDRVCGKGLFSLDTPYFRYRDDISHTIDYDLEQFKQKGYTDIML